MERATHEYMHRGGLELEEVLYCVRTERGPRNSSPH